MEIEKVWLFWSRHTFTTLSSTLATWSTWGKKYQIQQERHHRCLWHASIFNTSCNETETGQVEQNVRSRANKPVYHTLIWGVGAGSVFVFSKLRYLKTNKEDAKVHVVAFKHIKPDQRNTYTSSHIKKHAPDLLIYKSQQRTKCGNKTYFEIKVSREQGEAVTQR